MKRLIDYIINEHFVIYYDDKEIEYFDTQNEADEYVDFLCNRYSNKYEENKFNIKKENR